MPKHRADGPPNTTPNNPDRVPRHRDAAPVDDLLDQELMDLLVEPE